MTTDTTAALLTVKETKRRIRAAAALVRKRAHLPSNYRLEIGLRVAPVHSDTEPTVEDAYPEDDDLSDLVDVYGAARIDQVRTPGYVAHLYFTEPGAYGELDTTAVVWLGTDEEPASIRVY